VDLWLALFAEGDGIGRPGALYYAKSAYNLKIILRLKQGKTVSQASQELTVLQRAFLEDAYRGIFADPGRQDKFLAPYRPHACCLGKAWGMLRRRLERDYCSPSWAAASLRICCMTSPRATLSCFYRQREAS
jgi:hypothetical protein